MPGKHVEVVNTAMSAVNSFTLLDLADDIIEQQPDAVFIYAGHNEYLGLLGLGSQYTVAGSGMITRWFIYLKEWRVFQLIQEIIFSLKSDEKKNDSQANQSRTFMAKVAKHKEIPFQSDMFKAGVNQFETNMRNLLDKYRYADIPVFLSTIASNLSHQTPFASHEIEATYQQKFNELVMQAQAYSNEELKHTINQVQKR
jgi:lysophospholipase L1-like esterase